MQKQSLIALARAQLHAARESSGGRAAHTVFGGHEKALRQTLIALTANSSLNEHASPGEATLHVLVGRVQLTAGDISWEGIAGDLISIPEAVHALHALEDSAVLLTVVKR